MAPLRAMVVIQSKIREQIRVKGLRVSEEFLTSLSDYVVALVETSMKRCKANGRQTLKPQDV